MSIQRPALYVVATPIGNLGDVSYRAVALLGQVDLVLAEDTRVSRRLLDHYGISTAIKALHQHNEQMLSDGLASRIKSESLAVALVSDAGTPLVSDPGYWLVRHAHAHEIPVFAVPGPCAAVAALSISGLPSDRFTFEGFLPSKKQARATRLQELARSEATLVFYEAPHRIMETIAEMCRVFGGTREVALGRELTKLHETLYRGTLAMVEAAIAIDSNATRGEMVIIVAPAPPDDAARDDATRILSLLLAHHLPRREAVDLAIQLTGYPRNELYSLSLSLVPESHK